MYDGAANIIYWHSCCVEISISVYHYHFPVSVVDEDAKQTFPCERLARHIRPEFRRTLLERSGSPRNMFEGGLSSDPFPRRGRLGSGVTGTYVGLKGPREPPLTRGAKPPFGRAPN